MNADKRPYSRIPELDEELNFNPMDEAGSIGEEQCPAGLETKTDKIEWHYAAHKAKKSYILPEQLRDFLAGL